MILSHTFNCFLSGLQYMPVLVFCVPYMYHLSFANKKSSREDSSTTHSFGPNWNSKTAATRISHRFTVILEQSSLMKGENKKKTTNRMTFFTFTEISWQCCIHGHKRRYWFSPHKSFCSATAANKVHICGWWMTMKCVPHDKLETLSRSTFHLPPLCLQRSL